MTAARGATSHFIDFEITNSITDTITPFHLFVHGSTIMLGKESELATYWKKWGDGALAHGIMVSS